MPTVLVVDDNAQNLTLLSTLLLPLYDVRAVTSGPRALLAARQQPAPDLILLDVMMPGMDGLEVLRQLKAQAATAHIPVVFVTAMDSHEDEERGLRLGAVDYITKPIKPSLALARIRTQLELKAARDQLSSRNAVLEEELVRRLAENALVQDVSIHALAHLAEIRDLETGNHLRRVQGYMRTLCEALRGHPRFAALLTDTGIEMLVKSAPLHDIGKVGIPDHILLKPGRLTAPEWTVMQSHSSLGAEAIEQAEADAAGKVPFLDIAKQIARHHHERWDGSGYPDGLAGDAIPAPARLMAVADVFDALISRRPYKKPHSLAQSVAEVQRGRGSHFDPDIVDAFTAQADALCQIAQRHGEAEPVSPAHLHRRRGQAF